MNDAVLKKHLELVLHYNKTTNITRINSIEEGLLLHIEDSLSALEELNNAPSGSLVDLGSGAGYPGIPLAIESNRETLLVDSVKKKTDILDSIIEEIGFQNSISTYHGRIEDLSKEKQGYFSVATARALSSLPSLIELASPLLKQNGQLICYKAHVTNEELNHLSNLYNKIGMRLHSKREFYLSDNLTFRTILVFEKYKSPTIKLPRQSGKAQRNPF